MKVLIICNCSTGLEIFRGMLIRKLVEEGNIVNAIVPCSNEDRELEAEKRIEKMHCGLKRVPIDRRGMNPVRDLKLFLKLLANIRNFRPDVVITYTIKPNIYGGMACRLLKIPYIVNITGLGTAFQNKGALRKIVITMYKVALKKAKIVFFENSENRDVIVEAGIFLEEKSHVLAGAGVDLDNFRYLNYPQNDDKIIFLFIGRVMQEKGINELFAAMKKLRSEGFNCELDVLGGFEEDYSGIIESYEREGWLHYRGYQNDVRPYIQTAHCFVLPSWHEGMANTNLECAACGRPIITSDIPGCREAIEDGVTGYLTKKQDADNLYEVMKEFVKLPYEERKAMGVAGRKRMEEYFDKRKVVKETINYLLG